MSRELIGELSNGEIRISKSCCTTCTEALAALRDLEYLHIVKSRHNKPYIARLTDLRHVNNDIVRRVQTDFESWVRTIIIQPDSDVSDHETANPNSEDEANLQ